MKRFCKSMTILLSLVLLTAFVLVVPAAQSGVQRGLYSQQEYGEITTDENAAMLSANQNATLDFAMYVTKLEHEKVQAYMDAHTGLTDEEANAIIDLLHEEAVEEALASGLFPEDLGVELISAEDIPAIPDGLEGEALREAKAQQKKVYAAFLDQEEIIRRKALGLDASDTAMHDYRVEAERFLEQCCELSSDGRTATFSTASVDMAEYAKVTPILANLQLRAQQLDLQMIAPGGFSGETEPAAAQ